MDRKFSANAKVCGRCGERRPLVNLAAGAAASDTALPVCDRCLPLSLGTRDPRVGSQAASLLKALLLPRDAAESTTLPDMDAGSSCPRCGLTYAEFRAHGRAGCAACYSAFESAVRHALAVLHGPMA